MTFSFPVSANLNVRKLHTTAGMGLSKTPTAEIERNLYGSAASSVSKVMTFTKMCLGKGRKHFVRVKKVTVGRSGIYFKK